MSEKNIRWLLGELTRDVGQLDQNQRMSQVAVRTAR